MTGQDSSTGADYIEIAHEALIEGWPRLKHWIADARQSLRWRRELDDMVARWRKVGEDDSALLRGKVLAEAEQAVAAQPEAFAEIHKRFVEASSGYEQRRVRENEHASAQAQFAFMLRICMGFTLGAVIGLVVAMVVVEKTRTGPFLWFQVSWLLAGFVGGAAFPRPVRSAVAWGIGHAVLAAAIALDAAGALWGPFLIVAFPASGAIGGVLMQPRMVKSGAIAGLAGCLVWFSQYMLPLPGAIVMIVAAAAVGLVLGRRASHLVLLTRPGATTGR